MLCVFDQLNAGRMNAVEHCKELLNKIETVEIIKNIETFRQLDFKRISDEDLFKEISKAISVRDNFGEQAILMARMIKYPEKTRFYRVRQLKEEDHYIPLKGMTFEKDAWSPPTEFISRRGRLNNIGESLLYVSPEPSTSIEELKIKDNERFSLIVFESITDIKASVIGFWEDHQDLTNEENLKMRIINNFLRDEFTRDVGEGTEFLYRVSERIAKDYFDLPPRVVQDAWCYPSVARKRSVNVCMRPGIARETLKLVGVQICRVFRTNSGYQFNCDVVAAEFDNDGRFKYHKVDSDIVKRKFPEITVP